MSILCSNEKGWVISHYDYSKNLYRNVHSSTGKIDLAYNESIFKITTPFLKDQQAEKLAATMTCEGSNKVRKRRRMTAASVGDGEVQLAQNALKTLMEEARNVSYFQLSITPFDILKNNSSARKFVDGFYKSLMEKKDHQTYIDSFEGVNNISDSKIFEINNIPCVIPPYSTYVCCDINEYFSKPNKKFDFILLDPPWWNKHVRRKRRNCSSKGYKMMNDDDILKIPIKNCLKYNGLVGVWCTNAPSHIEVIKRRYFPQWGLDYVATWLWVKVKKSLFVSKEIRNGEEGYKVHIYGTCANSSSNLAVYKNLYQQVTEGGEPICSFTNSNGKKPYERIIFGAVPNRTISNPEESKCFLSIPSALHSHKPPITEILKYFLPENANCLELFARYLLPGWTSVGNEVTLLQSLKLFENLDVG